MAQSVELLFKELDSLIRDGDFNGAVSVCEKVLKIDPNDKDAFECKLVALIKADKYDEALRTLKENAKLAGQYVFEHAYCLYHTRQLSEAAALLAAVPAPKPPRVLQLEAQLYYRMEDYAKAVKVYEQLFKEHQVSSATFKTNLVAAYVSAGAFQELGKLIGSNLKSAETYEFAYNAACGAIEQGDLQTAAAHLQLALRVCQESLQAEGASDEEVNDELAIIQTQLAYVHQVRGNTDEALRLYNAVLKNKPSDESVTAVASNNVVAIKRDHGLFDSFNKLKQATSAHVEQKLSSQQKKVIGYNRCLLLLLMSKPEQCRELLHALEAQFSGWDALTMVEAALLVKEKKSAQGEALLQSFVNEHAADSQRAQLSLAQLHLQGGDKKAAIDVLERVVALRNKPGLVATLVTLYEQLGDIDSAIRVYDAYTASLAAGDRECYLKALQGAADFKLQHDRFREAAASLERIVALRPTDLHALPSLVIACSQFDHKLADKYAAMIPKSAVDLGGPPVDVDALEALSVSKLAPSRSAKKEELAALTDKAEGGKPAKVDKQKKKKKKKIRLPKNYDPNGPPPDPERWLPMRERAAARRRQARNKGAAMKGFQGSAPEKEKKSVAAASVAPTPAAAAAAAAGPTSPKASATAAPAPPAPAAATPPKPQQQQSSKPKKKRKN
eukprot:TRINITY_DN28393_c0_g1_i1.p1 TRINITY_DN28393_c0_g1~~TRINITY_DN28393_c0_g1_i1.p1  ORF type:complete len:671 (-),score=327.00 TRINITY_DN28393_c0_g1_i1:85-2097(-)